MRRVTLLVRALAARESLNAARAIVRADRRAPPALVAAIDSLAAFNEREIARRSRRRRRRRSAAR